MEITKITLEGLGNTRDLGGLPTLDGRKIIPHKLIRSGNLSKATKEDILTLTETYQLKTIIDFRTEEEQAQMPDPGIPNVIHVSNPILGASTLGITRESRSSEEMLSFLLSNMKENKVSIESYMDSMYENLVSDPFSRSQYRRFFELLLVPSSGAYLWHCTAGKDRVGVGTALLLSALDVPREWIVKDYMMTADFTKKELQAFLSMLKAKGLSNETLACVEGMFGVREAYLASVFSAIDQRFHGMDPYLSEEMGLDEDKRKKLKDLYLEG